MSKLHFITFANNEPFFSTQNKLISTIQKYTEYEVIFHNHNLNTIKNYEWFGFLEELFQINGECYNWRRDGYYNAWKPFLMKEVYQKINIHDILYYVDSSRHFLNGFEQSIDKFLNFILNDQKYYIGSVSWNVNNNVKKCCDILPVWTEIIQNKYLCEMFINKPHLLNSHMAFTKNELCEKIINNWVYYIQKKLNNNPLITYHHTIDQSIVNIIAYKYNLKVFYKQDILHNDNKNHNLIHQILNNEDNYKRYFINILDFN
jgi:hypothetical protein